MKKILAFVLSAVMIATLFSGCSDAPYVRMAVTGSSSAKYADFLKEKIGDCDVLLGIGGEYGVDMSDFEDDGYLIRTEDGRDLILGKTADGLDRAVRKYAKMYLSGAVEDTVYHEGYRVGEFRMFGHDISEFAVEYPASGNANMKFAASEFARLVNKACGAELEVNEGITDAEYAVELRVTDDKELKSDGYRYYAEGTRLIIEGAVARGCSSGVYRFLQNECGWDRLIYGDSSLREQEFIDIPADVGGTETPAFEYFEPYNYMFSPEGVPYITDRRGATLEERSWDTVRVACHGMQNMDWAELGPDRVIWDQPCLTDDDTYETIKTNILKYLKAHESEIGKELRDIDISQGDNSGHCRCEDCMKILVEEGAQSGVVIRFANRLAEEVDEIYPGIIFKVFAYEETKKPPKNVIPRDNVAITYCVDRNCSIHTIDAKDCNNEIYFNQIKEWSDISENVYLWYYALPQWLNVYSAIDVSYDNFRAFVEMNIRGIFLEEEHTIYDFNRIMNVVLYEFNWNPDMTRDEYDAFVDSVFESEYGESWEYVREAVRLFESVQRDDVCYHCWHFVVSDADPKFLNPGYYATYFDTMCDLMDAAIENADSSLHEKRAEIRLCPFIWQGCGCTYFTAKAAGDSERLEVLNSRFDRLVSIVSKYRLENTGIFSIMELAVPSGGESRLEASMRRDWSQHRDYLTINK